MTKIMLFLFVFTFAASETPAQFTPAGFSERLNSQLKIAGKDDYIKFFVLLRDRVDIEALDRSLYEMNAAADYRAKTVITALMQKSALTQGPLLTYLAEASLNGSVFSYQSYWVTNMIHVEAKPEVLYYLSSRSEVDEMELDAQLDWDRPVAEEPAGEKILSSEIGLRVVKAHLLWQIGITGLGRLVMSEDTGVDGNHPALNYKWRGNSVPWYHAWFDPPGATQFPNDCDNHGTHTTGIMTGRAGSDTIGVAPDAQWIAAKTICSGNSTNNHMAAFQWALNPDSNINTNNDIPDAINCSWHDPTQPLGGDCTGIYVPVLASLEAVGIAVTFSCGNAGPGTSTITRPKNMNANLVRAFCVGNINGNVSFPYPISSSSSRGPATCGGPGKLLFKPEVTAPGTSVRSSIRNGQYSYLSGTSMASPHIAGSVALLKQAFPNKTGKQILEALYWTAQDLGNPGEDNTYGMGVIDAWAAYQYLNNNACRQQNILILDNATNRDTININRTGTILNVQVTIGSLTHSRTGDIEFSIKSPAGTEVILASHRGGNGANYINTVFTDTATLSISQGTPPFTGFFRPEMPLDTLAGQNALGDWIFTVSDNAAGDTGRVMSYCIAISYDSLVGIVSNSIPHTFLLEQNYPNPFNPVTVIRYQLSVKSRVSLRIFDLLGREIAELVNGEQGAGKYETEFDGTNLASGVYLYKLEARQVGSSTGEFTAVKKMVLIR
jgi:subtilisin-like proprotein convertase family protein